MKDNILSFLPQTHPWRETIHYTPSITSTNDILKQLAAQGAPHGTILIAGHQTGGRGRLGRTFLSPPDVGIYMSVLLRPSCAPDQLMHLTCAAANAACDAIEETAGVRPGIKWTNDIVYKKRKLAGILTELVFSQDQKIDSVIIGIGINVSQQLQDFSEEIRGFAGSLEMAAGKKLDRAQVAAALIDQFYNMDSNLLQNKSEIMNEYRKNCITIGQEVSILRGDTVRHGKALDVDDQGGLIVSYPDNTTETVTFGEVSVRGMYHYV